MKRPFTHLVLFSSYKWPGLVVLLIFFSFFVPAFLFAQTFSHGNLAVLQVGTGTGPLTSAATPVNVVQYSTSGTYINSFPLPFTSPPYFTNSGTATSEGQMALSAERDKVVLAGYNTLTGTAGVPGTSSSAVPRVLFSVNSSGTISNVGTTSTYYDGNNIRSGTSSGTNYFGSGTNPGLVFFNSTVLTTAVNNTRVIQIFNGQTYFSSVTAPYSGVSKLGTGIPTTSGTPTTLLTPVLTSPFGFSFSPDGNTLYVADDVTGITKYTRSGTTFTFDYNLNPLPVRGLTVDFSGTQPVLYATTTAPSADSIIKLTDAGGPASYSAIATAPPNTVFRGITFSPSCYASISTLGSGTICNGSSDTLVISGNPTGVVHYNINGGSTLSTTIGPNGLDTIYSGALTSNATINLVNITTTSCSSVTLTGSVTITVAPKNITGVTVVCNGSSTALSDTVTGGSWTSSNTGVATIGVSSGLLTGVATGTALITYSLSTGCKAIESVTVIPSPSVVSGFGNVCLLASNTLVEVPSGGAWISGNTGIASIGSSSGTAMGVSTGTVMITYTLTDGCSYSSSLTVSPPPGSISGLLTPCSGTSTTLTDGGTGLWSSSNTAIATIGIFTGIVNSISAGTAIISFAFTSTGCSTSTTLTVEPIPGPVTGITALCPGSVLGLGDMTSGGIWSSSNTAVATVGTSTGIVSGVSQGTAIITYSLSGGCYSTAAITINASPPSISGITAICSGSVSNLSDAGSGTWSSGNTSVATIGATTGITNGVSSGTSVITFTLASTGCITTVTVAVQSAPGPVTGISALCPGSTEGLGDMVSGGTWSSSNIAIATVGVSTGIAAGVTQGTSIITYYLAGGCFSTATITVNPVPAGITGTNNICEGAFTTLTDAGGGTWTSGNTAIATIGSASGMVSGLTAGTSVIYYTLPTGCFTFMVFTVNQVPGAIAGGNSDCVGTMVDLSDMPSGGSWSSATTLVANIGSLTGFITGVTSGTTLISYILPTGCFATDTFTIYNPPTGIAGNFNVCLDAVSPLTDPETGGIWSSGNSGIAGIGSVSGIVNGVAVGTTTITYTALTGCKASITITVNALPSAITGQDSVCKGSTITYSDAGGGTWASSNSGTANAGSLTGIITGISPGTSLITYTNPAGCIAGKVVTVNPLPGGITGPGNFCVGLTGLCGDSGGGVWSSSNTGIATIGSSSGMVTGISPGTSFITYTLPTGCITTITRTVSPLPAAITGNLHVCTGSGVILSDPTSGGSWSSGNSGIATIGSASGLVNGVSAGTVFLTYTLPTGCLATTSFTVNPLPLSITGSDSVCIGSATTLSNSGSGGTWSSSNTGIASIGSSGGLVTGITSGTALITYRLGTGCYTTLTMTVNPIPLPIIGSPSICAGSGAIFTDATPGGYWASENTGIATIGSLAGNLSGLLPGTDAISYTLTTGCYVISLINVNVLPGPISGSGVVCMGHSTTLTDAGTGNWSSSNSAIASVGALTGIVSGVSAGTAIITFELSTGCVATTVVTVNPAPALITGDSSVCYGLTILLTDAGGGTWNSSNSGIASIGSASGLVTGIMAGTALITYQLSTGCYLTMGMTVNPLPTQIFGADSICSGLNAPFSDSTHGGAWSSTGAGIVNVNSTSGLVTGIAAGTAIITYSLATGCLATKSLSVNPTPLPITGSLRICSIHATSVSDATAGGAWSVSNTAVATINSLTGSLTGVSIGTTIISYQLITGCLTTAVLTIAPITSLISGANTLCAGSTDTLSETAGGDWTSSNTAIATIGTNGVVTGVSAGTVNITYAFSAACYTTAQLTVNPLPSAITGGNTLCTGANITLGNGLPGGTWSSSNTSVAGIGATTGIVTGAGTGTAFITYALPSGCETSTTLQVNPQPIAGIITGNQAICLGSSYLANDASPGGIWSLTNTLVASISDSGLVKSLSAGFDTVHYSVTNSCGTAVAVFEFTVYAVPDSVHITTFPKSPLCTNTQYQNFGTDSLPQAGISFVWSAINAEVYAVSSDRRYCLVNFTMPGGATIILSAGAPGSHCFTSDSLIYNIKTTSSPDVGVVYYAPDFVCTDYTANSYQWGYDEVLSLDSFILTGEINQNYTNPDPDFLDNYYWVITDHDGCTQKSYYNAPEKVNNSQLNKTAAFRLYPNPASSALNISLNEAINSDKTEVVVYDIPGRKLSAIVFDGSTGIIDISGLIPGAYMVTVNKNGFKTGSEVFIKK